tara:strand:- start:97 stop:267 length:171 start_codon:yes stop_codon:yes gene_type:complete
VLDNETARKVPALEETQENDFEKDRKFVQRGNLRDTYQKRRRREGFVIGGTKLCFY